MATIRDVAKLARVSSGTVYNTTYNQHRHARV